MNIVLSKNDLRKVRVKTIDKSYKPTIVEGYFHEWTKVFNHDDSHSFVTKAIIELESDGTLELFGIDKIEFI